MLLTILFTITFVFGPLRLLTFTKIFDTTLASLTTVLFPAWELNIKYSLDKLIHWISIVTFYTSLCYQAWYWLYK